MPWKTSGLRRLNIKLYLATLLCVAEQLRPYYSLFLLSDHLVRVY